MKGSLGSLILLATSVAAALLVPAPKTPLDRKDSFKPRWTKVGFESVRVPAALLSGTSFVAVNTAPLPLMTDFYFLGIAKRAYLIVGIVSFLSSLLSVLFATLALEKLSSSDAQTCTSEDDDSEYEFEYAGSLSHFLVGLLAFPLLVGLRAWIIFTCPRFGNIGLSLAASSFALMIHLVPSELACMPSRYGRLLVQRISWSSPCLLLALAGGAWTLSLFGWTLSLFGREVWVDALFHKACPAWNLRQGV